MSYKCPDCGSGLVYEPGPRQYQCGYCPSELTRQKSEEMTPQMGFSQSGETAVAMLYHYPSCGVEIAMDETTTTTLCFYCHNPVVLSGRLEGQYHLDHAPPFAVDRGKAAEIFMDWVQRKRYMPKSFLSKEQIEKMTGVYFPYWLYSCKVDGTVEVENVRLCTRVVGSLQYTEAQRYEIRWDGHANINRVSWNTLKGADRQLTEGVLPCGTKELRPLFMGYLPGFMAEKRDVGREAFVSELSWKVADFVVAGLRNSVSDYEKVSARNWQADVRDERWQYALMPVWTLTYRDNSGEIRYPARNGQTGKVRGQLPVDMGRLVILLAEAFLPLLAVLLVVGYLL